MRNVRNKWIRYGLLALVGIVFLWALIFPGWARHARRKDHDLATPQSGVATVVIVRPPVINEKDEYVEPQVSVRFRNEIATAKIVISGNTMQVNDTVKIIYRIGKSGTLYVDSVEPLPATHRKP